MSLATPFLQIDYWQRWFAMPQIFLTAPVPLLVALCAIALFRGLAAGRERLPFLLALAIFFLGFVGLGMAAERTGL